MSGRPLYVLEEASFTFENIALTHVPGNMKGCQLWGQLRGSAAGLDHTTSSPATWATGHSWPNAFTGICSGKRHCAVRGKPQYKSQTEDSSDTRAKAHHRWWEIRYFSKCTALGTLPTGPWWKWRPQGSKQALWGLLLWAGFCLASKPTVAVGTVVHPTNLPPESFHPEKKSTKTLKELFPELLQGKWVREAHAVGFDNNLGLLPGHPALGPDALIPQQLRGSFTADRPPRYCPQLRKAASPSVVPSSESNLYIMTAQPRQGKWLTTLGSGPF